MFEKLGRGIAFIVIGIFCTFHKAFVYPGYITSFIFPSLKRKREREKTELEEIEKERKLQQENDSKREILYHLGVTVQNTFAVELKTIHEKTTRDEIVRIVNLLAFQVATACINSDKVSRGEKVKAYQDPEEGPYHEGDSGRPWPVVVNRLKMRWLNERNLALQICPELADRLPHFSEFEPLKSYNAEHLLQKKAKQQASSK